MAEVKSLDDLDLSLFYYDETSPSCLRWAVDILTKKGVPTKIKRGCKAGSKVGNRNINSYWMLESDGISYLVHRVIYRLQVGDIPEGYVVDHINGDSLDNRVDNLRIIPSALNARNCVKIKSNKTGVNGVSFRERWHGKIYYSAFVAAWKDLNGKQCSKCFSIAKHGRDEAFRLASEYRDKMIKELNEQGAGYTERHGNENR